MPYSLPEGYTYGVRGVKEWASRSRSSAAKMRGEERVSNDSPALQRLFAEYRSGDVRATELLFGELQSKLTGFFRTRTQSTHDAEDLVQITLLKIHFARDRFERSGSLKTW